MIALKILPQLLKEEFDKIGIHAAGYKLMLDKSEILAIKVTKVRTPGANIIKQEMLAAGGDCAVNKECITGKIEYTDIILLGTLKHYNILLRKLKMMYGYFGLNKVIELIQKQLANKLNYTTLADGRKLSYPHSLVMGIINMTPDSFFSLSRKESCEQAMSQAEQMLTAGAAILDIGGESTRPNATYVSSQEEQERVLPIIYTLKEKYQDKVIISIDTYKADTAQKALEAGADIINDVTACSQPKMIEVAANSRAPIAIMHMRGQIGSMQDTLTEYQDIVSEVAEYLTEKVQMLKAAGITDDKIILDIGIGFGKSQQDNLKLLQSLSTFAALPYPLLLGASRKSVIGQTLNQPLAKDRLTGTLAITAQAVSAEVEIIRVHDVAENVQLIKMLEAIRHAT